MPKPRKYTVPEGGTRWMSGGYLKEVPQPHKRWYDDRRRKRPVEVTIMVYWGIGHHYYVSLQESSNAIWNSKEKAWQECWDDADARGRNFEKKCDNIVEAAQWVRSMQKKHFPKETHKFSQDWDNLYAKTDRQVWFGVFKQGD